MILIVTHKKDYTADFLINKLNEKGIVYYRLNCEDLDYIEYSLEAENGFILKIANFRDFHSVWFRRTKLPDLNGIQSQADKIYIAGEYEALLNNLYFGIKAEKWLSKPHAIYRAENKLYQLNLAKEIGFTLPRTLITNNSQVLKQFVTECNNDVVLKPLGQGRIENTDQTKLIYTNKLSRAHIEQLDKFSLTPVIYQENVAKDYEIRVTVVGEKVFSAKVDSQKNKETKIDWRRQKLKFEKYELPHLVEQYCIQLVKLLEISFGAIDLIKGIDGQYYFLEINPNGQWAWIEIDTKLDISGAIIGFLTK